MSRDQPAHRIPMPPIPGFQGVVDSRQHLARAWWADRNDRRSVSRSLCPSSRLRETEEVCEPMAHHTAMRDDCYRHFRRFAEQCRNCCLYPRGEGCICFATRGAMQREFSKPPACVLRKSSFNFMPSKTFPMSEMDFAKSRQVVHFDSDSLRDSCCGLRRAAQIARIDPRDAQP